jgi:hypothetical protein
VEPVHRDEDVGVGVFRDEPGRERRLAGAGTTRDPDDPSLPHSNSLTATTCLRRNAAYSVGMSAIYDLQMENITGEQVDFDRYRDQVLVIVNVASR